jgi:hypothetical protein
MFNGVEVFGDLVNAGGVPDGEDGVGDLVGPKVEVVDSAAVVKDKF